MANKYYAARKRLARELYAMMRGRKTEPIQRPERADPAVRGVMRVYDNLVELKMKNISRKNRGGGPRGNVTEYSDRSASRFRRALNRLHWPKNNAYFLTLTYPDEFQADPEQVHTDLNTFFKRLERAFPAVSMIWRVEWKRRKFGLNAGRIAPHFHALLFHWPSDVPDDSADVYTLWDWVRLNWEEIAFASTGADPDVLQRNGFTNYENALENGTRVDLVDSRRLANYYISKYMGKSDEVERWVDQLSGEILGNESRGRAWGIKGRKRLNFLPLLAVALSQLQVVAMRLIVTDFLEEQALRSASMARFLERFKTEYAAWMGYTFFADAVQFAEYFLLHRHDHGALIFSHVY